jgi:hypothetical protein
MALNGAMNLRERDGREVAIWRCALMRASKRELDVVFSIMGLFGVTLDPSKYQGGDRNQAIVDLTKSIMENGGKANWIGASLQLPVPSRLCTLPTLPEANIQGSAFIRTAEGRSVESSTKMRDLDWYLKDTLKGSIDSNGFLRFTAPISPISAVNVRPFRSPYEIDWGFESLAVLKTSESIEREAFFAGSPGTHAVVVGKVCHFMLPSTSARQDRRDRMLMLIKQHDHGEGWHKTGLAAVKPAFTNNWPRVGKRRSGLARPDRRPTEPDNSETKIWPDRSGRAIDLRGPTKFGRAGR